MRAGGRRRVLTEAVEREDEDVGDELGPDEGGVGAEVVRRQKPETIHIVRELKHKTIK